ncbi:MAG: ArnT family glycosyltransferase [Thermomicrobiales bacterium]
MTEFEHRAKGMRQRVVVAERTASSWRRSVAWQDILTRAIVAWFPLALALGLGGFLRLWAINSVGYNSDEAVYAGQAAALANDPELASRFPIFRAHPMLFQSILSVFFHFGVHDVVGRLLSVAFGMATIYLVYRLGYVLYGKGTGEVAALIVAVMPYHVVVTRQVLLDGPMTFFSTLALLMTASFAVTSRPAYLYASGAAMGLTFMSKETGFIMVAGIYAFLALTPQITVRLRDLVITGACIFATIVAHPLSVALAGRTSTAQGYLIWQLFRRPNHNLTFYPSVVPQAIGWAVIALAGLGLLVLWRERTWREKLLIAWILVPVAMFELWPVKGFQYLLPIAPALAVLAARTLMRWLPVVAVQSQRRRIWTSTMRILAISIVLLTLVIPSWDRVQPPHSGQLLAGSGGMPGGREAGKWIQNHVPEDAIFLTVGPSMANIIAFYGHREAYGLSVSPNPLHRNPSYKAISNPDTEIRYSELQYLVWDSFSGTRSPFFAQKLKIYADRYHGHEVHRESVNVRQPDGTIKAEPVIIIYQVRGNVSSSQSTGNQ